MTALWQAPAVLVMMLTWMHTTPATLAEAARHEALRRQLAAPSSGSYSNTDLPAARVVSAPVPSEPPPAPLPPVVDQPAPPEATEPGRDRDWWRARVAATRTALERDQVLADALETRVQTLQRDVIFTDDPAQQALARQQLGRALGELERIQEQVEADRKAISDLQEEARRQRVPPGWLRGA